jgi:acylphosphatase
VRDLHPDYASTGAAEASGLPVLAVQQSPRSRHGLPGRARARAAGARPALGLAGWVINSSGGILAEAEGDAERIAALVRKIREGPPPNSTVDSVETCAVAGRWDDAAWQWTKGRNPTPCTAPRTRMRAHAA